MSRSKKKNESKRKSKWSPVEHGARTIGYLRVSTNQQVELGSSLEDQEARLRAYAKVRSLELIRIEVDAGESGSNTERPGLQRALAALESGEVEVLLIPKLDRLTRSLRHFCMLIDDYFRDGSKHLISVHEHIDTTSAAGRAMLNIMMAFSEWERESAVERTASVMQHLKATGRYTGGWPPFGWDAVDGALVENADEQAVADRIRELRAEGVSFRAIAAQVTNPRTGKPFDTKQLQRVCSIVPVDEDA